MPLTREQEQVVRLALAKASCPGDKKWSAGGLLAQIALLTGNTEAELKHWDEVANGDGPLTLDRIQESGNAFAGWPLEALEALDRVWRAGTDANGVERVLERFTWHPRGEAEMAYDGPERRSEPPAPPKTFSIQQAVTFGTLLAMISAGGGYLARVDIAVKSNTAAIAENTRRDEERYRELRTIADDFQRTKLTYCLNLKADTARRAPDAGC